MSTSRRSTPKCSAMPRPVAPSTPSEWASSIISSALVPVLDLDEARQVRNIAVHAVDALDDDQHAAVLVPVLLEQFPGGVPVVVRKRPPAGARENAPLDDAVVRQSVVEHEVARAQQVPDHRLVRGVPAHQGHRIVGAQEAAHFPFQFDVKRPLPGDQPAGRCAGAVAVDGLLGGLADGRVARHAEIVVAREVDQLPAVDGRHVPTQAVVDGEEGVSDAGGLQQVETLREACRYSGNSSKR